MLGSSGFTMFANAFGRVQMKVYNIAEAEIAMYAAIPTGEVVRVICSSSMMMILFCLRFSTDLHTAHS